MQKEGLTVVCKLKGNNVHLCMLLPIPIGNVGMNLYLSQYLDDIIPEM